MPKAVNVRAFRRRTTLPYIALMFVVAVTMGVTLGAPPLPAVQIAASAPVEGDLFAHVDGFWRKFFGLE